MFRRGGVACAVSLATAVMVVVVRAQECPDPAERAPALHDQARLHADLMCDYNAEYRPVLDHRSTVQVDVGFILKYISFNSLEETFTVHSWVSLTWQDAFLKWQPSNYGNINTTFLESHQIWTPRMALFNADASKYQSDAFYTTCKVYNNGTVTCIPHLAHSGICRTSLKRWPYDTQNCSLYFGSWMLTGEQVNFSFDAVQPVNTDEYQDGPGWRLLQVAKKRFPGKYSCCPNETYPMLRYTFEMQREAAGPAAIVVVPSVAIVMLTLTSLMLDIKDNTRLIVACFSLFCHFMFLTEIGYDIPKESSETPIILLFIRDSMVTTLAAVLVTLVLQWVRARAGPAPRWVAALARAAAAGPARYALFTEFDPDAAGAEDKATLAEDAAGAPAPHDPHAPHTDHPNRPSHWLQLSNILNNAVLIISCVTYAVLIICYIPRDD